MGIEPRALHARCSTTELHPSTFFFFTLYFEIGAHTFVPLDSPGRLDLELVILLPEYLVFQASNTRPI